MPFKGMLKWAVAKDDLKQSTSTTTTSTTTTTPKDQKSKHRRHHHHHPTCCSVLQKVTENNARNIDNKNHDNEAALPVSSEVVENSKNVGGKEIGGGHGVEVQVGEEELQKQKCEQGVVVNGGGTGAKLVSISAGAIITKQVDNFCGEKGDEPKKSSQTVKSRLKAAVTKKKIDSTMGNSQSPQGKGSTVQAQINNERNNNNNRFQTMKRDNGASSCGKGNQADSKSLLYMSLDHLPLAIVKQYERMLQESTEQKQQLQKKEELLQRSKTAEDVPTTEAAMVKKAVPTKKKTRSATVVVDTKALLEAQKIKNNDQCPSSLRPGIIKSGNQTHLSSGQSHHHKKIVKIVSPSASQQQQHQQSTVTKTGGLIVNIKEAKSRVLPVHSVDSFRKKGAKRKTPSPELLQLNSRHKFRERCSQAGMVSSSKQQSKGRFKVTIVSTPPPGEGISKKDASVETEPKLFPLKSILKECKSSTLPRARKSGGNDGEKQSKPKKSSSPTTSTTFGTTSDQDSPVSSRRKPFQSLHNISIASTNLTFLPTPAPHDVTDPLFLEMQMPIFTPAVSRCAKKLTLKRSEIRKLERIKNQTEKLNRFLKKYYRLPNLPEEEEDTCSPEEKSLHLSVLRQHWVEKPPEESDSVQARTFARRNTLPTRVPVLSTLPEYPDSSNLLSSTAYYSDPILSSIPSIIESPERLLEHHRKIHKNRLSKQKSCTNLLIKYPTPTPSSSSSSVEEKCRRSSVTSCSSSCTSCTTCSSTGSTTTSCKCVEANVGDPSTTPSTSEESLHKHSNSHIHDSFLMNSHSHQHNNPEDPEEDHSLLNLLEKELFLRRNRKSCAIPTTLIDAYEAELNSHTHKEVEEEGSGDSGKGSVEDSQEYQEEGVEEELYSALSSSNSSASSSGSSTSAPVCGSFYPNSSNLYDEVGVVGGVHHTRQISLDSTSSSVSGPAVYYAPTPSSATAY